ncbi:MAG: asparaginase [Chloroflexota bacterium]|nr:asparaginase [Chloroflexota bacterium]
MPAILAEVTRGGVVESVHHGVVVAVDVAGVIVAQAGHPDQFAYFRSSAKPFQAVPLIESGAADAFGFTPAELALCCASHSGSPAHQTQVAAMLAKIGLDPGALRCGAPVPYDQTEGARVRSGLVPSSPLQCDCSGKHTGMLATCLHLGWPTDSYLDPDHPLQRRILGIIAEVLRVPEAEIHLGTDGCSLPTFGAPICAFATAYAALAAPERVPAGAGREHAAALDRLRAAMTAHPVNVAGRNEVSTDLMEASEGRLAAKTGAEGLLCLALPERGIGIAIRILDGSYRAQAVVAAAVLEQLDLLDPGAIAAFRARQDPAIRNHNGIHVGDLRPAFTLHIPAGIAG